MNKRVRFLVLNFLAIDVRNQRPDPIILAVVLDFTKMHNNAQPIPAKLHTN